MSDQVLVCWQFGFELDCFVFVFTAYLAVRILSSNLRRNFRKSGLVCLSVCGTVHESCLLKQSACPRTVFKTALHIITRDKVSINECLMRGPHKRSAECHDRAVNTYCIQACPGFRSLPRNRMSRRISLVSFGGDRQIMRHCFTLGHNHLLQNHFQFIVHVLSYHP